MKEMVKHSQGIYTTHMRSEGGELIEAVEEVLRIGFDAEARVHISHLKTSGEKNWGKIEKVIEKIGIALRKGLKITCDRYPYTAGSTDLDSVLPPWVYEEGHASELDRLKYERERIFQELSSAYPDKSYWENILVSAVNSEQNKWMEGKQIINKFMKAMRNLHRDERGMTGLETAIILIAFVTGAAVFS